jgi:hypothetical protein
MNPLRPAAEARVDAIFTAAAEWVVASRGSISAENQAMDNLRAAIRLALKEQDRDTRHACAEAVLGVGAGETNISIRLITDAVCTRAHAVCMNTHAV